MADLSDLYGVIVLLNETLFLFGINQREIRELNFSYELMELTMNMAVEIAEK